MYKKIYSFLAGLLILSACTAEDQWQDIPADDSVTFSFSVDAPSHTVVTKAYPNPDGERGVEGLKLYTFDASGNYLGAIVPQVVDDAAEDHTDYNAVIHKNTRTIHFISNYTGDLLSDALITSEQYLNDLSINEYVFWGKYESTSEIRGALDATIALYRNWAKLDVQLNLMDSDPLYDVSYLVYNSATTSKITFAERDVISLPNSLAYYTPDDSEFMAADGAASSYMFENDNQGSDAYSPTFVILRGRYARETADYTYYKIDLSAKLDGGETKVFDVIRNHHYKVIINKVLQGGSSWAEVIDPSKLADNNIIASAELNDYPKVALGEESLEVSKTTYIFTETTGSTFSLNATYLVGTDARPSSIELIQYETDLNTVLEPSTKLSITTKENHAVIEGNIVGATSQEKKGVFYVVAGSLQRRITLLVREAYNFEFWADPAEVIAEPGTLTNLKFKMPENVDRSVFPLECYIRTTKLTSVEPGIRIVTHSNGTYDYVYTAQEYQEEYSLAFKTNSSNSDETITLSAEYFNTTSTDILTIESPFTSFIPAGVYRYSNQATGDGSRISGGTVTVNYSSATQGAGSTSFETTTGSYNGGSATGKITLPKDAEDITLSYSAGGYDYTLPVTLSDLQSNDNKVLRMVVEYVDVTLGGTFRSGLEVPSIWGPTTHNQTAIPDGTITLSYTSSLGNDTDSFVTDENGESTATFSLPNDATVSLSYTISGITYELSGVSIASLMGTGNKDLTTAGTQYRIRGYYYRETTSSRISTAITLTYSGGSTTFTGGNQTDVNVYLPTNATVSLSHSHTSGTYTYGPVAISTITANRGSHIMTKE